MNSFLSCFVLLLILKCKLARWCSHLVQGLQPEFKLCSPRKGGRRKPTPESCPLIATGTSRDSYAHAQPLQHTCRPPLSKWDMNFCRGKARQGQTILITPGSSRRGRIPQPFNRDKTLDLWIKPLAIWIMLWQSTHIHIHLSLIHIWRCRRS